MAINNVATAQLSSKEQHHHQQQQTGCLIEPTDQVSYFKHVYSSLEWWNFHPSLKG